MHSAYATDVDGIVSVAIGVGSPLRYNKYTDILKKEAEAASHIMFTDDAQLNYWRHFKIDGEQRQIAAIVVDTNMLARELTK